MSPRVLTLPRLHSGVIRAFVEPGCAPTTHQLQEIFRVDLETIVRARRELEQQHGLVLHPHIPRGVGSSSIFDSAYAFRRLAPRPACGGPTVRGAPLGLPRYLVANGVIINSSFGAEGVPVAVHVDQHAIREPLFVHSPVPMARAWENVHFTCANMLLFASEADIDQWSGKHLSGDWTKWTVQEPRAIFEKFGFRGPTWDLATSTERF